MYHQKPCSNRAQCRVAHTNSYVRILHASPDAPGVDVYVNNRLIARDVTYREFTQYIPIAGGLYNIKLYPTGQTANPVVDTNVNIPPRSIFTIAATGQLANLDLTLSVEPPVNRLPGETLLRFAHLSPGTVNVDALLSDGTILANDIEYKEVTDYRRIRPGVYEFQFRPTGTDATVLTVPNINLRAGNIYTIYIVGLSQGSPSLQVLIPLDGNTYLQV